MSIGVKHQRRQGAGHQSSGALSLLSCAGINQGVQRSHGESPGGNKGGLRRHLHCVRTAEGIEIAREVVEAQRIFGGRCRHAGPDNCLESRCLNRAIVSDLLSEHAPVQALVGNTPGRTIQLPNKFQGRPAPIEGLFLVRNIPVTMPLVNGPPGSGSEALRWMHSWSPGPALTIRRLRPVGLLDNCASLAEVAERVLAGNPGWWMALLIVVSTSASTWPLHACFSARTISVSICSQSGRGVSCATARPRISLPQPHSPFCDRP